MHKLEQNSRDRRLDIRGRGILELVHKETDRERELQTNHKKSGKVTRLDWLVQMIYVS